MIRKFVLALAIGTMALGATACNTVRGAAEDVDLAADAVDEEL